MSALVDRIALVTGAGRGIGRTIALALARAGAAVAVGARDATAAEAVAAAIRAEGGRAVPVALDVTAAPAAPAGIEQALEAARALGPVDILVNNAGVAASAKIEDTSDDIIRHVFEVNVFGLARVTRAALADLCAHRRGRIINIASTAARAGMAYTSAYTASKHAVLGLTRAWALELATRGVTVNAVCPGWTDTDMLADAVRNIVGKTGRTPEQAREILAAQSPQRRIVTPDEVAAAVLYLASDGAAAVTGQALQVDGGMVMA